MVVYHGSTSDKIFILLAPGFEESTVVFCLEQMREAGLSVSLVSLSTGLVSGLHGLVLRPDYSLDQLPTGFFPRLIIVPGGRQCTSSLIADPRVHKLLETTWSNEGFVATTFMATPLFNQAGIPAYSEKSYFISQENMGISEFANRLINLVSG